MTPAPPELSPSLKRRGYAALAFNACFFAVIAWWLYNNVRYADFLTQLQRIPPSAIFLAMAINLGVLGLYGLRVATILRAKPLPCFLVTTIGCTFNALIPLRIGEGVKIWFGSAYFQLPLGGLGATIFMEKLYDLSAIVTLASVIAARSDRMSVDLRQPSIVVLVLALLICALVVARLKMSGGAPRLSQLPLLKSLRLDGVAAQAQSLLADHSVARAVLITAIIWTANVWLVFALFSTLLPDIEFGIFSAMTVLVIGALAIAVPASPAGLGLFEAGIVSYLTTGYGVPPEQAITAALAYHFCITAPHTIIAVGFLGLVLTRSLRERMDGVRALTREPKPSRRGSR